MFWVPEPAPPRVQTPKIGVDQTLTIVGQTLKILDQAQITWTNALKYGHTLKILGQMLKIRQMLRMPQKSVGNSVHLDPKPELPKPKTKKLKF